VARSLRVNLFAAAALSGSCDARRTASAAALGRGLVGQLRHAARSVRGRVGLALGRDIVGRQGRATRSVRGRVGLALGRGLVGRLRGAARSTSG
jgi:hypothetical protein